MSQSARPRSPRPTAARVFLALAAALAAAPAGAAGQGTAAEAARRTLVVGPDRPLTSVAAALEAASPGDTVRVLAGTYRERLRVDRPVVLVGEGRPVLDGGGEGHVIEATAPLTVRGFEIRGSGASVDEEHAGVMVREAPAVIEDNVLADVFYGIYLKDAAGSVIRGNEIVGKPLAMPRRGDGIRLWYSSDVRIRGNRVRRTRDVVVYFSDSLDIRENTISEGRYGLHYMYSDHNSFAENRFTGNQVGAFIMYSRDVTLRGNVFAGGRGASGMGLGLKDADRIEATGNLFLDNRSGVYLDNSPRTAGAENRFSGNLVVGNGAGVRMLPSVAGNVFDGNAVIANERPVEVSGGAARGLAAQNDWTGNHWGEYAGFDRDGDGVGDTPYVYARLSHELMSRDEALQLFARSPVMSVIETVSRFFPSLRPRPVVVDSLPRLQTALVARWGASPSVAVTAGPGERGRRAPAGRASPGWALAWAALAVTATGLTCWTGRRRAG